MHIVLVHGYLLQGTGSNIYVANVANTLKSEGHSVSVICQDRTAYKLDFVDEFYTKLNEIPDSKPDEGKIRVIVPPINNLLPVYVMDEYEGYEVKTVANFTEEEIENHIKLTGLALKKIIPAGIDLVIANHAILSPLVVKRALANTKVPYKVKIHGSAIEFQLVPHPYLMALAVEGIKYAKEIIAGSQHIKRRILNVFENYKNELGLEKKIKVVSPGMDPALFNITENFEENNKKFIAAIKEQVNKDDSGRSKRKFDYPIELKTDEFHDWLVEKGNEYNQRSVDADLPERFMPVSENDFNIIYFGKFLNTKGVGELMLLIPRLLEKHPNFRFFFVGFGTYREHLEGLVRAFKKGDKKLALAIAEAGGFITELDVKYNFRKLKKKQLKRITITGILNHELLSLLLPLMDLCVVPSKLAEAFGMVAVEAMASGVFPIVNYHSGLMEIADNIIADFPEMRKLIPHSSESFFEQLPGKISDSYQFLFPEGIENRERRKIIGKELREHSIEKYSWNKIVEQLIEL